MKSLRLRLALALPVLLAAAGLAGAQQASAASLNCWTRGAYLTAPSPGTWNNTFSHKVVCNQPVNVHTTLTRYVNATGARILSQQYDYSYNTNPSAGTFVNAAYATAPIFCGSQYLVTVTASAPNAGSVTYTSPWLVSPAC